MQTIATPLMWTGFAAIITIALAIDLLVLRHHGEHRVSTREALLWSCAWVALALVFNAALWWYLQGRLGPDAARAIALQFFTGYMVEKALAVDNMFVFLMLFTYFAVPAVQQQRALIYGIIGAIILRALMIFIGAALVQQFDWILYVFGAFLALTGIRMLWGADSEPEIASNPILAWIRRRVPATPDYRGTRFVVRQGERLHITPLLIVVLMVGVSDVIFAVDSIPAIFAITKDPFVVLTSNVFAVLGLRALYFLLAGMADRFHLLVYGLAAVLIFIGAKMLIADFYDIPVIAALCIVVALIGGSMIASLVATRPARRGD